MSIACAILCCPHKGNRERLKAAATIERSVPDACDRVADRHRSDAVVFVERILIDAIPLAVAIGRNGQIGIVSGVAKEIAGISVLIEEIAVLGFKDLARCGRIGIDINGIISDIAVA